MDRPGCEIKARRGVDLASQGVEPGGPQHRSRVEPDLLELLHQIAEHSALSAARGQRLFPQFVLEIGLAVGADDEITRIDYDDELETVVVRTDRETDFEDKLRKKTLTSGCAQGTVFGDLMEKFEEVRLDRDAVLRTSWLYALSRKINTVPSLYLAAGAIHGCVLCEEDRPLLYMEDVGRHNAIDKIAGYMHLHRILPAGKIFYTTGRLTSEMVIKTVQMGIPILISRSGFTAWGVDLARQAGLTLIGRAKGKRFVALAGSERIVFDEDLRSVRDEHPRLARRASVEEDAA